MSRLQADKGRASVVSGGKWVESGLKLSGMANVILVHCRTAVLMLCDKDD